MLENLKRRKDIHYMTKRNQAAVCVDLCTHFSTRRARRRLVREVPIHSRFLRRTENIRVERAISTKNILQAARTLYDLYLAQKFIHERPNRYYLRPWHLTPAAAMYTAKDARLEDDVVVGSCTIIEDSCAAKLPSDRLYAKELETLRKQGAFLSEASCFAVSPRYRKTSATTELMRAVFGHALYRKHTHIACIVSTSQRGFYGHLGFSQVGPRKNYSLTHIDPVVLMVADLEELFGPTPLAPTAQICDAERYWTTNNPYVHLIGDWIQQATKSMRDPSLIQSLCDACPEVAAESNNIGPLSFAHATTACSEQPLDHCSAPVLTS